VQPQLPPAREEPEWQNSSQLLRSRIVSTVTSRRSFIRKSG
jgi:hypothetical protein